MAIRCRSDALVSPVRTPVRISGIGVPSVSARALISSRGVARFFWTSLDRALSGETYTTWVVSGRSPASPSRTRSSMHVRNAAKVLPEPVGAAMRVCVPWAIAGQPWAWASVGAANLPLNQARTIGWNWERGMGQV